MVLVNNSDLFFLICAFRKINAIAISGLTRRVFFILTIWPGNEVTVFFVFEICASNSEGAKEST